MVFKRRNRRSVWRAIADSVYPRTGWRRALNYISHRLKRLPDTPHKIALGFSCGVFVCFSPLFGMHFFYATFLALLLRGNVLAALTGTFFGNPITFPIIGVLSYNIGLWLTGATREETAFEKIKVAFVEAFETLWANFKSMFGKGPIVWDGFVDFFHTVFIPYFLGGLAPGIITATIFYFVTRPLVEVYQKRRKGRLLAKWKELRATKQQSGADES